MKKIILLITGLVVLNATVNAQSISSRSIVDPNLKIKKASSVFAQKSTSVGLQNGGFETWTVDSFESISGSTILFQHPDMWVPLNGFIFSLFFNIPIPIEPEIDFINGNTAVKISVDTMNMGSDLVTIFNANERVESLTGQYQFSGTSGDARFEIYATKYNALADSSEIVGVGYTEANTTNGEYQTFTTTVQYMDEQVIPDSFYVFASYLQGEIGTWFKFDNLAVNYQSTGVSKELSSKLSVYPNPSKDFIQLTLKDGKSFENAEVTLLSLDGKIVLKQLHVNMNDKIDISKLETGIYVLNIKDDQSVITQKISKI